MASAIEEYSLAWHAQEDVRDDSGMGARQAEASQTNQASQASQASQAIEALVATFSGLLYRVAYSVLRHPAEAEDVVQETFLRVLQYELQNAGGLAAIRDLRPWLVRIAWNLSLDRKRRVQPDQMDDLFAASLGSSHRPADEVLVDARHLADVLAVIERLPHKERHVLLLSAVEELTTVEIASILGKSESSIRSLLFRARTHMQERLNKSDCKGGPRP